MRKKVQVPPVADSQVTGVIDEGCEFEGKLCFQGSVRINGIFRGEIYTPDTLIVGEGARVQGKVQAGIVIIAGEVECSIEAKYRVEIHRPAIFRGEIETPSLSVDEGVLFDGKSKMIHHPEPPTAPQEPSIGA